jgi:hypothetical protein
VRDTFLLEEAHKALGDAEREFQKYLEAKERITFRSACEKAWMATFLAADHLLMAYGFEKLRIVKSYRNQRNKAAVDKSTPKKNVLKFNRT